MDTKTIKDMISIIIPAYNAGNTLNDTLVSVARQSYENIEVICIDDGSTDGSLALMHRWASMDPRIRIIHKTNEGYGAACNQGILSAKGMWIAIVESDDTIHPDFCKELLLCAKKSSREKSADIIRCAYTRIFEGARNELTAHSLNTTQSKLTMPCPYKGRVHPKHRLFSAEEASELLLHHPAIWAGMYRQEYLVSKHIYFLEEPGSAWVDNPFMIQSLCNTCNIAYVDKTLYLYREHSFDDAQNFAKKNPLVPLKRANDMIDAAKSAGVSNNAVSRAIALRTLNYALITLSVADPADAEVQDLIGATLRRLDPQDVYHNPAISNKAVALFSEKTGLYCSHNRGASHLVYSAKEAACRIASAGIYPTVKLALARKHRS